MLQINNFHQVSYINWTLLYSVYKYNYLFSQPLQIQNFYLCLKFFTFQAFYFKTNIFFFKPKIRKLAWRVPKSLKYTNFNFFKKFNSSGLLRKLFLFLKKKRYKFLKKSRYVFTFLELKKKFFKKKVSVLKFYALNSKYFAHPSYLMQSTFTLIRRIFLTEKQLKANLWFYLHKISKLKKQLKKKISTTVYPDNLNNDFDNNNAKDKVITNLKKKIYYLNLHRPLIRKLRNARYCHWNIRTRGRLNEYRYHKLLSFELTNSLFLAKQSLVTTLLFSFYLVKFSWKQILTILNFELILVNGSPINCTQPLCRGDIIELPSKFGIKNFLKKNKKVENIILGRSNKLAYKAYLKTSKQNLHIRKHERVPKIFKQLRIPAFNFKQIFILDTATNTFLLRTLNVNNTVNIEEKLINKSVLSLQNWRYRFD